MNGMVECDKVPIIIIILLIL